MRSRQRLVLAVSLILLWMSATQATAQIPLSEYEQALRAIPVANMDFVLSTLEWGMEQPDFPATPMLRLIDRLAEHPAPAFEKEAIILVLARALEEALPIEGLVNMTLEGLARSVPLQSIEQGLAVRVTLLAETRDLLYSKGIFSAPADAPQSVPTSIPMPRFNQLLIHISESIGEFLESGGSPFDGHVLYQEVHNRLTMLQGVTLLAEDVDLVLGRLEPTDLTQVALAAVS